MSHELILFLFVPVFILISAWLLFRIENDRYTPALRFAIVANLVALGIGLITGSSLMIFAIMMFFTQLLILLVGGWLWFQESKNLHWRRGTLVLLLLFTPYVVGLSAATIAHHQYHHEMEAEDNSGMRAFNLPAPELNPDR